MTKTKLWAALRGVDWALNLNRLVALCAALSPLLPLAHELPWRWATLMASALGLVASMGPSVLDRSGLRRALPGQEQSVLQALGAAIAQAAMSVPAGAASPKALLRSLAGKILAGLMSEPPVREALEKTLMSGLDAQSLKEAHDKIDTGEA